MSRVVSANTHSSFLTAISNNPSGHKTIIRAVTVPLPTTKTQFLPLQSPPKPKQSNLPLLNPPKLPTPNAEGPVPAAAANGSRSAVSDVLRLMDGLGLPIPADIYASLIAECTDARDAVGAAHLHSHIVSSVSGCGQVLSSPFLGHRLLLMHVTCGCLDLACQLFDELSVRKNRVAWAILIVGFAHNGCYDEAVGLFLEMVQLHGEVLLLPPWLMLCLLNACVHTMNLELGKQVHGWLVKAGQVNNSFLGSSLISLYGKFGVLQSANFVFDCVSSNDTVVWTAAMVSNCREQHFNKVLTIFIEMGMVGVRKNSYTFSSVLKACGRLRDDGCSGRQVHADAIKHGVDANTFVACALIDMYGKCGFVKDATSVFEMVGSEKNIACWNAMLAGYIRHGLCIEALKFVYRMKSAGIETHESMLNEVRTVCGSEIL